jgi:hypothetical protein
MKSSYEDEEQSLQGTRATACSQATKECSISYEYRSRDEVANAILKLRGKEKHAEYINTVRQAQRAKWQQNPRRDVAEISKGASEPEMISKVVTPSHSFGTVPEQEYPSQNNRIDPKTEPTFTNTGSTKTKPAGLFVSNVLLLIDHSTFQTLEHANITFFLPIFILITGNSLPLWVLFHRCAVA